MPDDAFPLTYALIKEAQTADKALQKTLDKLGEDKCTFVLHSFVGGGTVHHLICNKENKIILPKALQERAIIWYHDKLQHPGRDRLYENIHQHFDWPKKGSLRNAVYEHVKTCDTCQKCKKSTRKYGQVPMKKVETQPWETVHIDLYGPKTVNRADGTKMKFQVVTMIDPVTGWFEMCSYDDRTPETIANLFEI